MCSDGSGSPTGHQDQEPAQILHRTADLAIGVLAESVGTLSFAGAVHVLYGSFVNNGLSATGSQLWTQNSSGVPGGSEADDVFGWALY